MYLCNFLIVQERNWLFVTFFIKHKSTSVKNIQNFYKKNRLALHSIFSVSDTSKRDKNPLRTQRTNQKVVKF